MSKIFYACFRESIPDEFSEDNLNLLSKRLEPDNITFRPLKIFQDDKTIVALFNPTESISFNGLSVCLGNILKPENNWREPKSKVPDGTYALFRSNDNYVELLSDMVASRTIWYYYDDNIFISSTSQRAIVFFLKSFQFNRNVIPWMLANGILGLGQSWDSRIKSLPGDSSLILNRLTWKLNVQVSACQFKQINKSKRKYKEELTQALTDTIESLNLDYSKWVLPLSGGYDSRYILCKLKDIKELKCVTWGTKDAQFRKGNDAYIAKKLANHYGKNHTYYLTNISNEPIEKIFNRFLICGEGRIDNISAYMDGFKIWKDLYKDGIHGIIRGDEAFGWIKVSSELDVRFIFRFSLLSDYGNLKGIHELGIHEQTIPEILKRKDHESLESWRDRVYLQNGIPLFFAALNDLKLSFTEIANPFLTRKILSVVRELPDNLRTNKKLFKTIVNSIGPNISYAKKSFHSAAIADPREILKSENVKNVIKNELTREYAKSVLPSEFITYILINLKTVADEGAKQDWIQKINVKKYVPKRLKSLLRSTLIRPKMDFNQLAFRSFIICAMNRIFIDDAKTLQ